MDQVPLSIQDSVDRVGQIPADLAHPQPIRSFRNPADLDFPGGQLDEK